VLREPGRRRAVLAEARTRHGAARARRLRHSVRGAGGAREGRRCSWRFRNLIDNAIRYAAGDVHVELRVRPVSARRLEVEVADRGVGIPASALDRVFLRFSRLPQEAVRTARGLGLGLYIVRNVARAHGGNVRAESEGEGKGSRFILTLPGHVDERTRPSR
jgi:signal transduction histidine kinase